MENWKDIPGYEGYYQASSLGRIRSLDRVVLTQQWKGSLRIIKGTTVSQHLNPVTGYLHVKLSRRGKKTTKDVHRLVAITWFGVCPNGAEVLHGPAGASDNSTDNLKYGTRSENHLDGRRDGTRGKRVLRNDGETYPNASAAAEKMMCARSAISRACRQGGTSMGYTWEYA